jgi:hypothetical protein
MHRRGPCLCACRSVSLTYARCGVYAADTCPLLSNDNNADWAVGVVNAVTTGTCVAGWFGTPTRLCTSSGWQTPTVQCQRTCHVFTFRVLVCAPLNTWTCVVAGTGYTCANVTVNQATYATALSGDTLVAGVCDAGWTGAPQRNCSLTGVWIDVPSSTPCTRTCACVSRGGVCAC